MVISHLVVYSEEARELSGLGQAEFARPNTQVSWKDKHPTLAVLQTIITATCCMMENVAKTTEGEPPSQPSAHETRRVTRSMSKTAAGHDANLTPRKRTFTEAEPADEAMPTKKARKTFPRMERQRSYSIASKPRRQRKTDKPTAPAASAPIPDFLFCTHCEILQERALFDLSQPCYESHLPETCNACVKSHLLAALEQGDIAKASCPTCKSHWPEFYLEKLLFDPADREKYHSLAAAHPKYRPCLATGCDAGQIHTPGLRNPLVICEVCSAGSCFAHEVSWHAGLTCAEYYDMEMGTFEGARTEAKDPGPAVRIKTEHQCPECHTNIFSRPEKPHVLVCEICVCDYCVECLAAMESVRTKGAHYHQKTCKFWAHKGWDKFGDVRRGVDSNTKERENHAARKASKQQLLQAWHAAHPGESPSVQSLIQFQIDTDMPGFGHFAPAHSSSFLAPAPDTLGFTIGLSPAGPPAGPPPKTSQPPLPSQAANSSHLPGVSSFLAMSNAATSSFLSESYDFLSALSQFPSPPANPVPGGLATASFALANHLPVAHPQPPSATHPLVAPLAATNQSLTGTPAPPDDTNMDGSPSTSSNSESTISVGIAGDLSEMEISGASEPMDLSDAPAA